jgi:aryl-alcohol dehydrogenase-like predicted oxidoreductase
MHSSDELGKTRPERMSRLGLGAYPLGGGYGTVGIDQARATVDVALDCGLTFVDTAEAYLDSEEKLGEILKGRRDRVFLATKAFPSEPYTFKNLQAALEGSLRRLDTDRIDLYQLHGPEDWLGQFERPTPIEELAEALSRLRESGKVLHVGICNLPVPTIDALVSHTEVFSTQNLYSIIDRGEEPDFLHLAVEAEVIPYAARHGLAFIAYSPLSRGLLVGNQDPSRQFDAADERYYLPRYQRGIFEQYVALAQELHGWATDHGHSLTQLAIAWTLQNPGVTSTLIGAKTPEQVRAVVGADHWALGVDELAEIDSVVASLSSEAKAAKMVVWDHFDPAAVETLRKRRATDVIAP